MTDRDVVKGFTITNYQLTCGGQGNDQGTYTYPPLTIRDRDKVDDDLEFFIKDSQPSPFGDPSTLELKARGNITDLGTKAKGRVRVFQANCGPIVPWKATS